MRPAFRPLWLGLLAALFATGCGGEESSPQTGITGLSPSGSLGVAVAEPVRTIDPLAARSRSERLVARQIFEPLVSRQRGPFGSTRIRSGIARSIRPSRDGLSWTATLRPGVRFTSGAPLDAEAVTRNVERWLADPRARSLLPSLSGAFSPRPGRVQFSLSAPDPRFGQRLADGRLGLVSPVALDRSEGGDLGPTAAGAGPFELRARTRDSVGLARNTEWWGTPLELGPGVDQIEVETIELDALRADWLLEGRGNVADQLDRTAGREVSASPLHATIAGPGGVRPIIGIDRSVRGLNSVPADRSLAEVWLTTLR